MTDTANAPERIWTADTTSNCSVGFNTPSLDYKNEYISRAHCDELVAAAKAEGALEAQAKIARLTEALAIAGPIALEVFDYHLFTLDAGDQRKVETIRAALRENANG